MDQSYKFATVIALAASATLGGYAQSLGDVARAQRQKQAQAASTSHKVITNEDMPANADGGENASPSSGERQDAAVSPASNDMHAAQHWKSAIQAQKSAIASLQSQIDKMNSSIHFVEANRYSNGVQYNQKQVQKQDEVQRMQKQLDEQKKQLEDMQEQARRAGLGSSVYDP